MDADYPQFICQTTLSLVDGLTAKWPESPPEPVRWCSTTPPPGITVADFRDIIAYALEDFHKNCGLRWEYTPNEKTANAIMRYRRLGGPGGVLAQSELPVGLRKNNDRQLAQEYDGEAWSSEEQAPRGKISMPAVIRHECGHLAGLDHDTDSSALLYPTLNPNLSLLQPRDIARLVKLYGPPSGEPTKPVPVPTPTTKRKYSISYDSTVLTVDLPTPPIITVDGRTQRLSDYFPGPK